MVGLIVVVLPLMLVVSPLMLVVLLTRSVTAWVMFALANRSVTIVLDEKAPFHPPIGEEVGENVDMSNTNLSTAPDPESIHACPPVVW